MGYLFYTIHTRRRTDVSTSFVAPPLFTTAHPPDWGIMFSGCASVCAWVRICVRGLPVEAFCDRLAVAFQFKSVFILLLLLYIYIYIYTYMAN